jgi:hypothetical protein
MTFFFHLVGMKGDHCTWSLEVPGSIAREVWSWSDDTPNPPPPPDAR